MQAPEEKPSKSARKRRMHELQRLGGTLLQFSDAQLRRLPLTEALREAVREGKRLKAPAALQRHCQFLGRLLDEADNEALLIAIVTLEQGTQRADPWHHQAERGCATHCWRARRCTFKLGWSSSIPRIRRR
jgi:ribosome-associated protein